jgi:hypothetical protein
MWPSALKCSSNIVNAVLWKGPRFASSAYPFAVGLPMQPTPSRRSDFGLRPRYHTAVQSQLA